MPQIITTNVVCDSLAELHGEEVFLDNFIRYFEVYTVRVHGFGKYKNTNLITPNSRNFSLMLGLPKLQCKVM